MQQRSGVPVGRAWFAGVEARGVVEHAELSRDDTPLRGGGFWAVVGEFEGPVHAWRFEDIRRRPVDARAGRLTKGSWRGPAASSWSSSLGRDDYCRRVDVVREAIR
ncbi:MAG: anthranilate synthase component I family protein, partial [Actinotalea sp.]|nr:anthranilate synthase component I family protein [Actinotalea sp.]